MKRAIRILLVEDNEEWLFALRKMYRRILDGEDVEVIVESDASAAKQQLTCGGKFDLLSADINMGDDVDGLHLIETASDLKSCNGVVVITAAARDDTLERNVRDKLRFKGIRQALQAHVEELFPGRNLKLDKDLNAPISENIELFEQYLTPRVLLGLSAGHNRLFQERRGVAGRKDPRELSGGVWCISFAGKTIRLPDSKGVKYVAALIRNKNQLMDCLRLKVEAGTATDSERELFEQRTPEGGGGRGGNVDDISALETIASYRTEMSKLIESKKKLNELKEDAGKFENWDDVQLLDTQIEELDNQLVAIGKEIERSLRNGRIKKVERPEDKRLRQSVSRCIHDFLGVLQDEKDGHPALWKHLHPDADGALHVGYKCQYISTLEWDV